MLKKVDLTLKLSKEDYKKQMESIGLELGQIQREAREIGLPVIIVFEGWRHSRRGDILNEMMQQMDARGFSVHSSTKLTKDERLQPFFTSYWKQLPIPGGISVYRNSWYYIKNEGEIFGRTNKMKSISYDRINAFEKQLVDGNYVLLKYFIHISEEQQKINREKAAKAIGKAWREISNIYSEEKDHDGFLKRYDDMLKATDTVAAPWHVISGDDLHYAKMEVYKNIIAELKEQIEKFKIKKIAKGTSTGLSADNKKYDVLSEYNPAQEISKEDYKKKLDKYQDKLKVLQVEAFQKGISTIVAFEGWDAGGKGGAIRRLTAPLDPVGYEVTPVAAPNAVERMFHYLWRFWVKVPASGEIAIFDRTWYGRVMVERVEKFTPDEDWRRAYDEINETEAQWVADNVVVVKFWLHIDKDEQERRFKERQANEYKTWKITDEDWRNREKWDEYEKAVNEMLAKTSTDYAPWTVVEGNSKNFARIKVLKTVIEALEKKLGK